MFEKLKQKFSAENNFTSATLILIITLICSNVLGLLRNRFLAQKIPQYDLDTYLAAFRVPDLLFNLLVLGAISAVFIPVFTEYISKKNYKTAWHIANSMINLIVIAVVILSVVLYFAMPWIVNFIVPGFDDPQITQTIKLSRLLLFSPLFFGLSYVFSGILNSFKRFLVYSLAPLVYNLAIIVAIFLFADNLGVWGIGIGVIFGAFLHMFIQAPVVYKLGWRWQPIFDFKHEEVKKMGKLMIPRVVGLASSQIVLIVFTYLASMWIGHVTYFNFANDIQTFFSVVFGSSFAIAMFPILSENAAKEESQEFAKNLAIAFKQIIYYTLPLSILVIMLRAEIVRLILGTGFYDWNATIITADALGAFAVGVWAASLVQLLARAYYAHKDTLRPTIISLISVTVTIFFGIYLSKGHGNWQGLESVGLAFASSIGSIINFFLLASFQKEKKYFWNKELLYTILKYLIAIIFMIIATQISKIFLGNIVNMRTFAGVFIKTIISLIIGIATYLSLTYWWKCDELESFMKIFKRKTRGIEQKSGEAIEEQSKTDN